jgi:uncharacterized protein (DUF885 family)
LFVLLVSCHEGAAPPATPPPPTPAATHRVEPAWIGRSDANAKVLLDTIVLWDPELGSALGLEAADVQTVALGKGPRAAHLAALGRAKASLEAKQIEEADPRVAQDLAILARRADLDARELATREALMVPLYDVSRIVFWGMSRLLDDQVVPARRGRALARLQRYVGMAPGSVALTVQAKADLQEALAAPGRATPAKIEVEKALATSASLRDGVEKLLKKYGIAGYEPAYEALTEQLAAYDDFLRTAVLPRARTDFALPPLVYALNMEDVGVDIPPADLAAMAHAAFTEIQADMQRVAADVAKAKGLPSTDYRDVIRALKKDQLVGEAILPAYQKRLAEVEAILVRERVVTLPTRPARMRLGTPAENAAQPAPHMIGARFIGNTGERGEFVLPLSVPAPTGSKEADSKYDDFTFEAVSWPLVTHEVRPGHELQFDTMLERGVPLARTVFAHNSTNTEGWGLYSEWVMQPYMPPEGQLCTMQLRLLRAARAFLDPELQEGRWTFESARDLLMKDVVLSTAFATEEVERFTFRAPGQATSYFYGFTKLLALRKEVEAKLGPRFDAKAFHDAILDEGFMPPALLRTAVLAKLGAG